MKKQYWVIIIFLILVVVFVAICFNVEMNRRTVHDQVKRQFLDQLESEGFEVMEIYMFVSPSFYAEHSNIEEFLKAAEDLEATIYYNSAQGFLLTEFSSVFYFFNEYATVGYRIVLGTSEMRIYLEETTG